MTLSTKVNSNATYVLRNYGPGCDYTCIHHQEWGFHFGTKIIINIFLNNKQRLCKDTVRKDTVTDFKKRQRTK